MPFVQNFSAGQSPTSPNIIVLVNSSTGVDAAIVSQRIYITDSEGNPVVPTGTSTTYILWSVSDLTISVNVLTTDQALSIRVDLLNVSNTVLYTLTQQFCFDMYNRQFLYQLVQMQGLVPNIVQDNNYFSNLAQLWTNILGAENAITVGDDISASQNCLNRATYMMQNQSLYF